MPKRLCLVLVSCLVLLVAACNSSSPPAPAPVVQNDHGHDHAHGHSHEAAGPHGGHLVELGDEAYHLEWTHDDDTGLVTLYVLDGSARQLVPIEAESITMTAKITDTTEYQLAAVAPAGDPPLSAQFELRSPELIECLKLAGQGTDVSVAVTIQGKEYQRKIEHLEHGHHH